MLAVFCVDQKMINQNNAAPWKISEHAEANYIVILMQPDVVHGTLWIVLWMVKLEHDLICMSIPIGPATPKKSPTEQRCRCGASGVEVEALAR